jgi:hypothetical protein
MRMKSVVIGAVLATMSVTASAWADVDSVAQVINDYGLTAVVSGSTITVTGTKNDAPTGLEFAEGGMTIDWRATLKADCATFPVNAGQPLQNRSLIFLNNAVDFRITAGEIAFSDEQNAREYDNNGFVNIIIANSPEAHIFLEGGAVSSPMRETVAIKATSNGGAQVTLTSGTVDVPSAEVVQTENGKLSINEADLQGGSLIINGLVDGGGYGQTPYLVKGYGNINIGPFTVPEDVVARFETGSTVFIPTGTTVTINGTVVNFGTIDNNGTINNNSSNTLDNQGTLTNNGTINNAEEGKITNTGTIDNANGRITNGGTIANSGTIKSDAANFNGHAPTGNSVEPIDSTDTTGDDNQDDDSQNNDNTNNNGGGGGGCDAGYGLFGLSLTGLAALKRRA